MTNIPIQPITPKIPVPLKYIKNSLKYIGNMDDLRTRGHTGDICTYRGTQYVWTGNQWESFSYTPNNSKHIKAMICNQWESFSYTPNNSKHIKAMICTQCGAPIHNNICEYCGTEYK